MRAVLTYHSIDDSGSPISVRRATFEQHAEWLASGAVRVTSLAELMTLSDDLDAVAISFDDGFESVAKIAAPLLRERNLPATIFVVTGHVGRTNMWGGQAAEGIPVMPLMDWTTLSRLAEEGFTLGAHSGTHPDLTRIDPAAVQHEIRGSIDCIASETGTRPTCFAYPYGRVTPLVAEAAASACSLAFTTELRPLQSGDSPFLLPRLDAYYFQARGRLESWGRPQWHAYVKGRAVLRAVRALVTQ
jgi:peptidoglycan/xylan/chitin deacetylase (PgdA/CDA1 family)